MRPEARLRKPIPDEDYGMEDDIVNRFVEFIRTVYGEATLETNLKFVADALGNKGATSHEVIRNYFLNDFFKDHCSTYSVTGSGKRPIYWLFDSGKQNGFKALVYMHRWNADTMGNVRVEYLHRMQHAYEREIQRMTEVVEQSSDSKEVARAEKRLVKLRKQLKETQDYDARLGHLALSRIDIDLDDGVKVNYVKVQTGSRVIHGEFPVSWRGMVMGKSGSCRAFVDNLMNNLLYSDWYNDTAERIYRALNAETLMAKLGAGAVVDCALFAGVDDLLIRYMTGQLVVEDVGVSIHGKSVPEVCQARRKTHFGQKRRAAYFVLEHACYIIGHANYAPCETLDKLTRIYTESLYEMDRHYRYFWYSVDQLEDSSAFDELKTLVENVYTNDWLTKVCVNWNEVKNNQA